MVDRLPEVGAQPIDYVGDVHWDNWVPSSELNSFSISNEIIAVAHTNYDSSMLTSVAIGVAGSGHGSKQYK